MKKIKYIITLLALVFILSSASNSHEYYVSVTKMEYVKEEKSLQIISQIFIDDFEKLIREVFDVKSVENKKQHFKGINQELEDRGRKLIDKINAL